MISKELHIEFDGETLWDFFEDRSPVSNIQGPVGSGKTRAAIDKLYMLACEQHLVDGVRESRWLVTRATSPELKNTIIKDFQERFPEELGWGEWTMSPPITFRMRAGDVRAEFVFLALDDEGDLRKLRSTQFTGAYINEAQFVPLTIVTEIKSRLGRYPGKKYVKGRDGKPILKGGARWPLLIMDMNAADESHWVPIMRGDVPVPDWFTADQIRQHEQPMGPDGKPLWRFFVQPPALVEVKDGTGLVVGWRANAAADNMRFLPAGYYEGLIAGQTKEWIDLNCMNRTGALRGGKAVFTGWNRDVHVAREPLRFRPDYDLIVGVDFGRTPAATWGQMIGGRWYVLGEFYLEDVGADVFGPALKRELLRACPGLDWQRVRIWGDPAGDFRGQSDDVTAYQIMAKHGLTVRSASMGLRFGARKEAMDGVLARMVQGFPGFLVDAGCRMLIQGFGGGYKWRSVKGRDGEVLLDEPVKNKYSHPMDSLLYLLAGAGEVREVVMGGTGPKPVDTRVNSRVYRRDRAAVFRRRA